MQINTINELALTAADDKAIGALLDRAFARMGDNGYHGRSYYKQRHHLRIIVRDNDQIIGHIALLIRAIRLGKTLHQIIGLADVATNPDHEGQGIGSAMLKEAIAQSRHSLADFIMLFGDHPMYAKHGFQPMRNFVRYVIMDDCHTQEIVTRVSDGLMVLPLRETEWDTGAEVDLLGHLF